MFLRQIDMLSPKITLYYNKKNIHASAISGILTIIAFLLILSFGLLDFIKCIYRQNPTTYFFQRYAKDIGTFAFNESNNFFNYIQIINIKNQSNIDIDFNKVEIIGINLTMSLVLNEGDEYNYPHWLYDKCDNETNIKGIENLIDNDIFTKSACIKYFYNPIKNQYYDINDKNFEWPYIEHSASNLNITTYGVIVKKCMNSSFKLNGRGSCSSDESINNYLTDAFFIFTILDHYVDLLSYKNPISNFLYYSYCRIEYDYYIINNLNFNPGLILNFDNLFNDNIRVESTYFFEENSQYISLTKDTKYLAAFFIWPQNTQQYYERHYHKIYDILSEIGGYANIIIIIAQYINYIISRFNMLSDTQELLSNIVLKNNSLYNDIIFSKNIKQFMINNINKKNEDNQILKMNNIKQNKNNLINTDNSCDGEKDISKINIINRIKVIKNNLGDETNRINGKNEKSENNINIIQNIYDFDMPKKRSNTTTFKYNFLLLNQKEKFNCWNYFIYLLLFKKYNKNISHFENLRRLIISEECIIQNFLNIYYLIEFHHLSGI